MKHAIAFLIALTATSAWAEESKLIIICGPYANAVQTTAERNETRLISTTSDNGIKYETWVNPDTETSTLILRDNTEGHDIGCLVATGKAVEFGKAKGEAS